MAFTAKDVQALRERPARHEECKKALTETDGDMDKAIEVLREKGLAAAAKNLAESLQKVLYWQWLTTRQKLALLSK